MNKPRICVLLATYNGIENLKVQIDSILNQDHVDITIFAYDDQSRDGTRQMLEKLSRENSRVILAGWEAASGGAFQNFKAAVLDNDCRGFDYIAFSDQDDIWQPFKISHQISCMQSTGASGSSSSVIAFYDDMSHADRLVNNVGVQTPYDYLFEGGGQGCTYLFTPDAYAILKSAFRTHETHSPNALVPHDWLLYALCRVSGRRWLIVPEALVMYRQHRLNVMGARGGLTGLLHRAKMLRAGIFRKQRLAICHTLNMAYPGKVPSVILSENSKFFARFFFAIKEPFAFRRFKAHSLVMAVLFICKLA